MDESLIKEIKTLYSSRQRAAASVTSSVPEFRKIKSKKTVKKAFFNSVIDKLNITKPDDV